MEGPALQYRQSTPVPGNLGPVTDWRTTFCDPRIKRTCHEDLLFRVPGPPFLRSSGLVDRWWFEEPPHPWICTYFFRYKQRRQDLIGSCPHHNLLHKRVQEHCKRSYLTHVYIENWWKNRIMYFFSQESVNQWFDLINQKNRDLCHDWV